MSTYRVRPRFKIETPLKVETLTQRIALALDKEDAPCKGRINSTGFGSIMLPVDQQHYWSPRLTISMEETEDGTIIRGLYGPRPAVWTMFVFFYSFIGFGDMALTAEEVKSVEKTMPRAWFSRLSR